MASTRKGIISSPLTSSATTKYPLYISLALNSISSPLDDTPHSAAALDQDVFDQLDSEHDITLQPSTSIPSTAAARRATPSSPPPPAALSSSTSTLFPSIIATTTAQQPSWITATSSRITALSATRVSWAAIHSGQSEQSAAVQDGGVEVDKSTRQQGRTELRIAVGTEEGTLWLFAPPPPPPKGNSALAAQGRAGAPSPPQHNTANNAFSPSSRQTSFDSFRLSLRSPTPTSPPNPSSSPPPPPSSTSPPPRSTPPLISGARPPPTLSHRASNTSIATRRSLGGVGVGHPGTHGSSTPSSSSAARPRKASATVSISSPTFDFDSAAGNDLTSRPMSPTLSTTSAGGAPSIILSPTTTKTTRKGQHVKAKDSITVGIGLWETESTAVSVAASRAGEDEGDGGGEWGFEEEGQQEEEVEEELEKLRVVARVRLAGRGAIVEVQVVEGLRFGREEGGRVLVVLRGDGRLSLHSLVDGRSFGASQAGGQSAGELAGFRVLQVADSTLAICHSRDGTTLVVVDLDSLQAQPAIISGGFTSSPAPAVIFKQGIHFLVFASSTPSSPAAEAAAPTLLVRPVFCLDPPSTPTTSTPLLNGHRQQHSHALTAQVQVRIEAAHSAGRLDGLLGCKGLRNVADDLIAWDEGGLLLFTIREQVVVPLGHLALRGVVEVCVEGYNAILVCTEKEVRGYRLLPREGGAEEGDGDGEGLFAFHLVSAYPLPGLEAVVLLPSATNSTRSLGPQFLVGRSALARNAAVDVDDEEEQVGNIMRSLDLVGLREGQASRVLYEVEERGAAAAPRVTASVRVDRERVLLGYSSGILREARFVDLGKNSSAGNDETPESRLGSAITVLEIVEIGDRHIVVAGAIDGSAGAWDLSDWSIIGRWNLFASPVSHLACLWDSTPSPSPETEANPPTTYTLAFISANSPVSLISLSLTPSSSLTSTLLFTLPGTKSPVESLSTSETEVLVVYEQGLARTCHLESRELRRSMDRRTARGVLKESGGGWRTWFELGEGEGEGEVHGSAGDPILTLDLRVDLEDALRSLPWAGESKRGPSNVNGSRRTHLANSNGYDTPRSTGTESPASASTQENLGLVRLLLANLVTFGVDEEMDALMSGHLGIQKPERGLQGAVASESALSFPVEDSNTTVWTVSPVATAQRLLQIVCLLRVFLNFPDTERCASQVIVFYASFLQDAVGASFAFPSLDVLADYWLDKSNEVQQAARSLFGTYLAASSDARVLALVERWQDLLPSRQVEGSALYGSADQALLVTGIVATERFKLLSASLLKDVALSIGLYLDDDSHPYHQSIATELCSRGFHIWQNYLDAMSLVRQLFGLATGRNPSTPNELRGLARSATLHVAGVNTPLFITTLLHDILDAPSATHRNATLKLLGFMIRKKPLVLYTSLPRIAEAVVKSLDPTVTDLRETVHQAATVILNDLVRTYPSIDFHHKSQRLAVGTHEGSTIIYDLKTATRLYVLEGHKRPVTALSWSPDGHRLVSVALEESKAVVWKVGLGILSLFMPGAPPRQGSGGGTTTTPFKTFEFHVGDEAHMTNAATLEWVVFEWPAERTARLKIRETALNFGC